MRDDDGAYDAVANYCADLVSDAANEAVLRRILRKASGQWTDVLRAAEQLGVDLVDLSRLDGGLYATWLDAPEDVGMVIIVFCMPNEVWSTIAMYNRSRIVENGLEI